MTNTQAINTLCERGGFGAEMLNALHACRDGHPLNGSTQWRNAAFMLRGRVLVGGECHEARRVIEANAEREARQSTHSNVEG